MITRHITRGITSPIARSITSPPIGALTLASFVKGVFANGEIGYAPDYLDLSTLYQDSAGTTPVPAAGKPVGLALDKSKGLMLGPELAVNGDFSSGLTGWTQSTANYWSVVGGRAYHPFTDQYKEMSQLFTGKTRSYLIQFDLDIVSGEAQWFYLTDPTTTVIAKPYTAGSHKVSIIAPNGLSRLGFSRYSTGGEFYVDNISVRELSGNHAFQATAASRPMLRDMPRRLDYDGVDDALNIAFPSSLGSACTVARSIPGIGAQILTAQAIGTSFSDNVDNCGMIIVNRALTPTETANLTRIFNRLAGV